MVTGFKLQTVQKGHDTWVDVARGFMYETFSSFQVSLTITWGKWGFHFSTEGVKGLLFAKSDWQSLHKLYLKVATRVSLANIHTRSPSLALGNKKQTGYILLLWSDRGWNLSHIHFKTSYLACYSPRRGFVYSLLGPALMRVTPEPLQFCNGLPLTLTFNIKESGGSCFI